MYEYQLAFLQNQIKCWKEACNEETKISQTSKLNIKYFR